MHIAEHIAERIAIVALLAATQGAEAQRPETFQSKLDEILARPDYRHSEFGIALYDLDASRMVFAHNAGKFFTPGSTTKLLTVGTALAYLGPDFRFHTSVYRTGAVRDGRLTGDLVLVASGDPNLSGRVAPGDTLAFTNEDHSYGGSSLTKAVAGDPLLVIRRLASQVASSGIRRIDGRVLVDVTLFSGTDGTDATAAVSPVVVNDNVIDVTIGPGVTEGAPAKVTVSPDLGYARVVNGVITGPSDSRSSVVRVSDVTNADGTHTVRFEGGVPANSAAVLYSYPVPDPARFAAMAFVLALKEKGVTVTERARAAPPDFRRLSASYAQATRVAEHVSPAFAEEAKVTLKVSQNLHASMMPYLVGALVAKKVGRDLPQAGFDLEREFLQKAGLAVEDASQGDGAGGAPGAFYTPEFIVRYLAYMATRPDFALFQRALPILGRDGTLWNIQPDAPAAGKVFAKTGTFQVPDPLNRRMIVTGKGLAGYMTTSSGRRLALCLYANRVPRPTDAPGGAALLVGQVLGEIANAAWRLPIDAGTTADSAGTAAWHDGAPHQVRMIRVAPNVSVEVLDFGGTGDPILFLHGYGNTAHSFDDFAPRLTDQYRVFAMTRRGNGASSRPDTGYSITTLATDIRIILDSLGISRVHLAGHSFGGDQITKFALLFPERLRSLVYLDAAHDRKDLGRGPPGPPRAPPTASDSSSLGAIRAYLARVNGTAWPEAEVHAFYRFSADGRVIGRSTGGAGPVNTEIAQNQEHPDYAHIRAPALAFYALQPRPEQAFPTYRTLDASGRALAERNTDYWYKWALVQMEAFRRGMRDGQVVVLTGANHFVFISHENDVLRAMREFFDRHRNN
jgi:D-alanyl-D-alanine carboxypeptidase/D-alanyl-D-alanine-endopeptidase (penicillin-binding protein 4)